METVTGPGTPAGQALANSDRPSSVEVAIDFTSGVPVIVEDNRKPQIAPQTLAQQAPVKKELKDIVREVAVKDGNLSAIVKIPAVADLILKTIHNGGSYDQSFLLSMAAKIETGKTNFNLADLDQRITNLDQPNFEQMRNDVDTRRVAYALRVIDLAREKIAKSKTDEAAIQASLGRMYDRLRKIKTLTAPTK